MTKSIQMPQQGPNVAELMRISAEANKNNQAVSHPSSAEGGQPPTGGHFGMHFDGIDDNLRPHGSIDLGHGGKGISLGALTDPTESAFTMNFFAALDGSFAPVIIGNMNEAAGGIAPSNLKFFEHEGAQMKPSGLPGFHNTEQHVRH